MPFSPFEQYRPIYRHSIRFLRSTPTCAIDAMDGDEEWRSKALKFHTSIYNEYEGAQFHSFADDEQHLLRSKICYAIYGPPSVVDGKLAITHYDYNPLDGYTNKPKEYSAEIMNSIVSLFKGKFPSKVYFLVVFILCKQPKEKETIRIEETKKSEKVGTQKTIEEPPLPTKETARDVTLKDAFLPKKVDGAPKHELPSKEEFDMIPYPVFRICTGDPTGKDESVYVDAGKRMYKDWQDYLDNNKLPPAESSYPEFGYYSCGKEVEYDATKSPRIKFSTTPLGRPSAKTLSTLDVATSVTALGSGALAIAGGIFALPFAAPVLGAAAVAGTASALYGAARSGQRLVDKGTHGESLTDQESAASWLAVVMTPVALGSAAANAAITKGAQQSGRVFTPLIRGGVTTLNCTNAAGSIGIGLKNMYDKNKNGGEISPLDVVQFSMSVFFFSHTIMQPVTARGVINRAQEQHFNNISENMSDPAAKANLKKFVADNNGDIVARSKIVRSLNRMNNPEVFFEGMSNVKSAVIGGRKGKTIVVTDSNGTKTRINPNRTSVSSILRSPVDTAASLTKAIGKDYAQKDVNGKKIFKDCLPHEAKQMERMFQDVGEGTRQGLFDLAGDAGVSSTADFISFVEMVMAHRKVSRLSDLNLGNLLSEGRKDFITGVKADVVQAGSMDHDFASPFKAAYHYRKHGGQFRSGGEPCSMNHYVKEVPSSLFKDGNRTEVRMTGDVVVELYSIPESGEFGVLQRLPNGEAVISTVFKNMVYAAKYMKHLHDLANTVKNIDLSSIYAIYAEECAIAGIDSTITLPAEEDEGNVHKLNEETAAILARSLNAATLTMKA